MKRFLEDYGFTILAAIVVISLIMIVTPVGSAIQKQTGDLVHSFAVVADNDFNKIDDSNLLIDLKNFNKSGVEGDFSRKGNLVTINNTQYRVLAVNGTQVKVMSMVNIGSSVFNSSSVTTSFGDKDGQKYADSKLDQAMTSYYNGLPEAIKTAIVPQTIKQSMYSFSNPMRLANKKAEIEVGQRYIYALDVDDVIEYLGNDYSSGSPYVVNKMFFDTTLSVPRNVCLRSADSGYSGYVFYVSGDHGYLYDYHHYGSREIRPAFVLDLSLLSE